MKSPSGAREHYHEKEASSRPFEFGLERFEWHSRLGCARKEEKPPMEIRFSVFVRMRDSGDLKKYSSITAMQNAFERIDVENDEYEAWDANGVPLSLSVQQPIWLRVEPHASAKPHELAAAIAEFAQRSGISVDQSSLLAGKFEPALDEIQQKRNAQWRSRSCLGRFLRAK